MKRLLFLYILFVVVLSLMMASAVRAQAVYGTVSRVNFREFFGQDLVRVDMSCQITQLENTAMTSWAILPDQGVGSSFHSAPLWGQDFAHNGYVDHMPCGDMGCQLIEMQWLNPSMSETQQHIHSESANDFVDILNHVHWGTDAGGNAVDWLLEWSLEANSGQIIWPMNVSVRYQWRTSVADGFQLIGGVKSAKEYKMGTKESLLALPESVAIDPPPAGAAFLEAWVETYYVFGGFPQLQYTQGTVVLARP